MSSRLTSNGLVLALAWFGMLASGGSASGNGRAFFMPAGKNVPVDLVYFGNIRDRVTRRPLDFADVTVFANDVSMTFPFANDRPGHYRSPDVGFEITEVGARVDTSQVEIVCFVEGYKEARRVVPRKSHGTIQVDFLLERDGSGPQADHPAHAPLPLPSSRLPAIGLLVLLASAVAVRTSARRRSTRR